MAEPRRRRVRSFEWSTAIIASISIAAGIAVYLRDGTDKVIAILTNDLELLVGMLPKMAAGCLIAAFVTRLLPREVVARVVGGESGLIGLLVAMTMGAVLPGGPLTIYPVAGAFLVLGADVGTAVAFITAWNLLGYNRALIWELPFFGPEFVGWRILMALPLPIIAGLLARAAATLGRPARRERPMDLITDHQHRHRHPAVAPGSRARLHGGDAQQGAVPRGRVGRLARLRRADPARDGRRGRLRLHRRDHAAGSDRRLDRPEFRTRRHPDRDGRGRR